MKIVWLIFACLFMSKANAAVLTQPVMAKQGMVVTEQKIASQVGVDILRAGGNAIDAAVAVGYALAVVNPCCGNIGGGGFMTIRLANGKAVFLNFREKAPLKATKEMYLKDPAGQLSIRGYLAVAVPGTVLGLETALQKYGTMTRQQVMAPAIKLAAEGYRVTAFDAEWFAKYASDFREQPTVAAIFLKQGYPYKRSQQLIQPDLAHSLQLIAQQGPRAFYQGPIAQAIVKASEAQGGLLTMADFANYTVEELTPIYCQYRGYSIISAAPPSSGGVTLCEMLNILENFSLNQTNYHDTKTLRYIIEAMRYSFFDRNIKLGDPHFVTNPIQQLLSKPYAKELSEKIRHTTLTPLSPPAMTVREKSETTHYSIVDKQGNAVAVTYTLNGFFGAKIIAKPTGFFLNNEMDDFAVKPGQPNQFGLVQYDANSIQPGKRPLSSMTPTIVLKDGQLFMVIGSPGGPRIITAVLLTLLNVVDYGMNIQEAVNNPRFHFQGEPDVIDVEPFAFSTITAKKLQIKGYQLAPHSTATAVEAILIQKAGSLQGANDYRRPDGAAIGY